MENKVQFGLRNVHYAVLSLTDEGVPSWGTPVHVPGAVNLTLDAQGEVTPFYADDIVYYRAHSNNGYTGDLELARVPDQMLTDIWGMTKGSNSKVLTENAFAKPKSFALLYQIDGDESQQYYCLYNCSASRPGIGSSTKADSTEPVTQTCTVSADPLLDGNIFARTTADTPAETKAAWFSSVYTEAT